MSLHIVIAAAMLARWARAGRTAIRSSCRDVILCPATSRSIALFVIPGLPPLDRMAPAPAKPPARRQSAIPALHTARDAAGPARHLSGKPPPRGRFSIAAPAEAAALAQSQLPAQPQPPPARASMKPRKSLAGAALRINLPVDATGPHMPGSKLTYIWLWQDLEESAGQISLQITLCSMTGGTQQPCPAAMSSLQT